MTQSTPQVETYNLLRSNGSHIRQATLVRYEDGTVVRFTEKMSKREALRQAEMHR